METMKIISILALLLSLVLLPTSLAGQSQSEMSSKYPNELPGFKYYENAKWKSLEPLVSTMADVRRILGEPNEAHDVSQFTKPYPGDAVAKRPVFTYELDNDWQILIYFVRYCFYEGPALPASLDDRLCTIDLVPKKRIPFGKVEFPAAFKKQNVTAVDAAWDEYADGSGLVYEVYTTKTPYDNKQPGDLNRITYGPSDETIRKYASK
jgi:hypothetical protein